ncbi:MAG: 3-dehydroquinate synthase [Thermocladium sp.]
MRGKCGSSRIVIGGMGRSVDEIEERARNLGARGRLFTVMASSVRGLMRGNPIELGDGESSKQLETAIYIIGELLSRGADRWDTLIAVGGGSLLDVAGFAASIYKRGIDYVNVPTTLLAMVDAAIGGKTGVDYGNVKNVIGTFHQPRLVLIDPTLVETLDERNYVSGLAEVIKYGLTLDAGLYDYVESHVNELLSRRREAVRLVVERSASLKAKVVEEDEREELGKRFVLNFGHTIGHAVEGATGFSITHGEAVALGMKCELGLGVRLGVTHESALTRFTKLCESLHLCGSPPVNFEDVASLLSADKKKRGDSISMPLVKRVGEWELIDVGIEELRREVIRCLSTP